MLLFFQILVLLLTALLWWNARRDLTARAAAQSASELEELENLRESVEKLSANLEQRAAAAQAQIADAERRMNSAASKNEDFILDAPARPESPMRAESAEKNSDIYAPVRALADAGITDASEIARQTGLGRGEIELVLGLRARR